MFQALHEKEQQSEDDIMQVCTVCSGLSVLFALGCLYCLPSTVCTQLTLQFQACTRSHTRSMVAPAQQAKQGGAGGQSGRGVAAAVASAAGAFAAAAAAAAGQLQYEEDDHDGRGDGDDVGEEDDIMQVCTVCSGPFVLFALNCSPSTVCPLSTVCSGPSVLFALKCLPSTVCPQLTLHFQIGNGDDGDPVDAACATLLHTAGGCKRQKSIFMGVCAAKSAKAHKGQPFFFPACKDCKTKEGGDMPAGSYKTLDKPQSELAAAGVLTEHMRCEHRLKFQELEQRGLVGPPAINGLDGPNPSNYTGITCRKKQHNLQVECYICSDRGKYLVRRLH
jgi:hypothetical protein